jgi:hypothetical protein
VIIFTRMPARRQLATASMASARRVDHALQAEEGEALLHMLVHESSRVVWHGAGAKSEHAHALRGEFFDGVTDGIAVQRGE